MNKADNLPMSADEYYESIIDQSNMPREHWQYEIIGFMDEYANYLLSHHIKVLAERIAEKAKTVCGYGDCDMTYCDMQCQVVDSNSILEIAKDYINEIQKQ